MRQTTAKKLVEQTTDMHDNFVGGTDDGCFIDMGSGIDRVRLELPLNMAIDIVSSVIAASWPAAHKSGHTIDSYLDTIAKQIGVRVTEAALAANKGPAS